MEIKIAGEVRFKNRVLAVYGDLDAPLFKATDIADLVEYGDGNVWNLVRLCEEDEHLLLPLMVAGQFRQVTFVTETGLYNILSQSRKPVARAWRLSFTKSSSLCGGLRVKMSLRSLTSGTIWPTTSTSMRSAAA